MSTDLDKRKARIQSYVKWGAAAAAVIAVAPFMFLLIGGLLGLALAGTIGAAIIYFAPVVGMKFANWKLKAVKAEARENPIETLENQLLAKKAQFNALNNKVNAFNANVLIFADEVRALVQHYPHQEEKYAEMLAGMKKLSALRKARLEEAHRQIGLFTAKIQEQKAIHRVSLSALAASQSSDEFNDQDVMSQIQIDESLFSVRDTMNKAMADLDSSLMELEFSPSKKLDLDPGAVERERELLHVEQRV